MQFERWPKEEKKCYRARATSGHTVHADWPHVHGVGKKDGPLRHLAGGIVLDFFVALWLCVRRLNELFFEADGICDVGREPGTGSAPGGHNKIISFSEQKQSS